MSLYTMDEICEGCIHANWHSCCDTFCYCSEAADNEDEDNINYYNGTCKLKEEEKV